MSDRREGAGQPDWPPSDSASAHAEGVRKYGSTGQLWQSRNGQWVRIEKPKLVQPNPMAPREKPAEASRDENATGEK